MLSRMVCTLVWKSPDISDWLLSLPHIVLHNSCIHRSNQTNTTNFTSKSDKGKYLHENSTESHRQSVPRGQMWRSNTIFHCKQNGWLHALLESAQVFTGCIYSGEVLSMGVIPICTMNTVKSWLTSFHFLHLDHWRIPVLRINNNLEMMIPDK